MQWLLWLRPPACSHLGHGGTLLKGHHGQEVVKSLAAIIQALPHTHSLEFCQGQVDGMDACGVGAIDGVAPDLQEQRVVCCIK
jgi:hypothetical protein